MTSTTTVSGDPAATTFSDTAALTLIATGLVALVASGRCASAVAGPAHPHHGGSEGASHAANGCSVGQVMVIEPSPK